MIKILFPIKQAERVTQDRAIEAMTQGINTLLKEGAFTGDLDDILVNYEFQDDTGYAIAELNCELADASKLNTVGASEIYEYPINDVVDIEAELQKTFSAASLQDRLKLFKFNPKVRLRYLIMDYKRFWKAKKSMIEKNPKLANGLRSMFIMDMTGLMNEVLPFIVEGKQLNQLVGISQVTPNLSKISRELSLVYRRALKASQNQGQIPKAIFSQLKTLYSSFMNQLIETVMPGINPSQEQEGETKEKTKVKSYALLEDGRVDLFSEPELVDDETKAECGVGGVGISAEGIQGANYKDGDINTYSGAELGFNHYIVCRFDHENKDFDSFYIDLVTEMDPNFIQLSDIRVNQKYQPKNSAFVMTKLSDELDLPAAVKLITQLQNKYKH